MSKNVTRARVTASYQRMGDGPGDKWMSNILGNALEQDLIKGYQIMACETGVWGLELILFQIDLEIPLYFTHEEAKDMAGPLLNDCVGDSDVEVLWVSNTPIKENA